MYCLPEGTLAVCQFTEKDNPHHKGWTPMKMYSRSEIRKRSRKRFDGLEGLVAERKKREEGGLQKIWRRQEIYSKNRGDETQKSREQRNLQVYSSEFLSSMPTATSPPSVSPSTSLWPPTAPLASLWPFTAPSALLWPSTAPSLFPVRAGSFTQVEILLSITEDVLDAAPRRICSTKQVAVAEEYWKRIEERMTLTASGVSAL